MNNFIKRKEKGFTLIEALVAISILMVAVTAPITIAQKGLSSAVYSKEQMIASYLVQDGIEYIKNKRDENVLNKRNWLEGMDKCITTNGCQVDTVRNSSGFTDDITDFSATSFLRKDSANGFYQYDSGQSTKFTRQIKMEVREVSGQDDEVLVTATVRWGDDQNVVSTQTLIYNY